MNDDLIRREDAIEALGEEPYVWTDDDEFAQGERSQWIDGVSAIKAVPSADRPQEWVDKAISIIDDMQSEGIVDYEQAREFRMRARMKGADDEV